MIGLWISVAALCVVAVLQHQFPDARAWQGLDLSPWLVWHRGEVWRLVTYAFIHSPDSTWHVALNALALWIFGRVPAAKWGARRFVAFFVECAVGAGILASAWPLALDAAGLAPMDLYASTVGASGAVFGVLAAFSILGRPDGRPSQVSRSTFMRLGIAPLALLLTLLAAPPRVSHIAHVGGIASAAFLLQRERLYRPRRLRFSRADGPPHVGHGDPAKTCDAASLTPSGGQR